MKTKNHEIMKKVAILLASISLVAVAAVPVIAGGDAPEVQGLESEVQTQSVLKSGEIKTIMIVGVEQIQFVPQAVTVSTNDRVVFINQDNSNDFPYSIVAVDSKGIPTGEFESGLLYTGDRFEISFGEQGIYRYVDSLHPETSGVIAVI